MIRPLAIGLALLAVFAAGPANAQTPATSDEWKTDVTLYLFGAGLNGTVGALGRTAVVDQSFSDILSNLEFAAMGALRLSKGRWQVTTDFAYTGLGVTAQTPPADINVKTSWLDMTAGYAVKPGVSLLFGGRVNRMKNEVAFKDATRVKVAASKTWLDPEVGVALTKPLSDKLSARLRADIGGFGLGSDLAWQLLPALEWKASPKASLLFAYRVISTDYSSGEGLTTFTSDTVMSGPAIAFTLHF
jgi:hypothetical protein